MTNRTCDELDCDRPHRARGLCGPHYNQKHRTRSTVEVACPTCGTVNEKVNSGASTRRFCDYTCRDLWRLNNPYRNGAERLRKTCRLPNDHPVIVLMRVTAEQQREVKRLARANERRRRLDAWRTSRNCTCCGAWFTPLYTPTMLTCSPRCARAVNKGDDNARRRAATSGPERITWRTVVQRDGLSCYLCGFNVDPHDYTYQLGPHGQLVFVVGLEYPSLDHVVPLAAGGAHTLANAALAHTYCNSIKRDLPLAAVITSPGA